MTVDLTPQDDGTETYRAWLARVDRVAAAIYNVRKNYGNLDWNEVVRRAQNPGYDNAKHAFDEHRRLAIAAVNAMDEPQPQWKRMSDLPKERRHVLAHTGRKTFFSESVVAVEWDDENLLVMFDDLILPKSEFTGWCDLPSPPAKEGGDVA